MSMKLEECKDIPRLHKIIRSLYLSLEDIGEMAYSRKTKDKSFRNFAMTFSDRRDKFLCTDGPHLFVKEDA